MDTFGCTPRFLADNPKAAQALADSYFQALDMIKADPKKSFEIMGADVKQSGEQFAELQPQRALSQLQAATGTARAAVVVAFAELVGVLEAVGAAAAVDRTGQVLALEDVFVDAQRPQDARPMPVRAGLHVAHARFKVMVHGLVQWIEAG